MIPRSEVGLIFAGSGPSARVFDARQYAAVVTVVMASIFMVPPWLKALNGARR